MHLVNWIQCRFVCIMDGAVTTQGFVIRELFTILYMKNSVHFFTLNRNVSPSCLLFQMMYTPAFVRYSIGISNLGSLILEAIIIYLSQCLELNLISWVYGIVVKNAVC